MTFGDYLVNGMWVLDHICPVKVIWFVLYFKYKITANNE